ncbi:MAG: hypothetical protein ABFQ53_01885 [Patescibacteria group bacterium]
MKKSFLLMIAFSLLLTPAMTLAVSGTNIDEKYVEVKTKQGGEWFVARKVKTDEDSSLRLKDVLPGKYIFSVEDDDIEAGQTLGLELRMKDEDGKNIKEKTDVDAYIYIGDMKMFAGTFETDKNGYLDLEGILLGMTYELDVKGDGKVKKKDNLARIKTKAKIDGSDWFQSSYDRLDEDPTGATNGILEIKNALPGKYKFKLKSGDPYNPAKPFMVKARMRKENGKKIKKPTEVKVYVYMYGVKTKVAEIKTDKKGWITLPQVQPGVKYKLKVKD